MTGSGRMATGQPIGRGRSLALVTLAYVVAVVVAAVWLAVGPATGRGGGKSRFRVSAAI